MSDTTTKPLPAERGHWYYRDGRPCYEVPCTSKDGMRPTHVGDARKLDLLPGYTTIARQLAQPGLRAWQDDQLLDSALTLPVIDGELADDRKKRIIIDAEERSRKARDDGTALHKAIEQFLRGEKFDPRFSNHIANVCTTLTAHGIDLSIGSPERSFASALGYGGKVDWSTSLSGDLLLDFKSKKAVSGVQKLAYDEHGMQIAAYMHGVYSNLHARGANVFVGIDDAQVRFIEWSTPELFEQFEVFKHLLAIWQIRNSFEVAV